VGDDPKIVRVLVRSVPQGDALTIADIADREGVSRMLVGRAIAQARRQLFGELSDRGIRARTLVNESRGGRTAEARFCAGCGEALPADSRPNRDCCDPTCRKRRQRRKAA
jgi:hypothetical protein